jgi:uncharacterized protein
MRTVIGIPARGEDYLPRPSITQEIWSKLEKGGNLLLVAPRRVGKSSILLDLLDNPKDDYIIIYYISESVNNTNEFYKKLFNHVNEKLNTTKKYKNKIETFSKDFISRIESISVKNVSIALGESKLDYRKEFENMLDEIEFENERLIILVDEFAQTVENIIEDIDERTAVNFLETKREIRLSEKLHKKVQFIYAGSIGLENIVSKFNGTKFINDLTPIPVSPLTTAEAKELVIKIIKTNSIKIDDIVFEYLVKKIDWLIPFYFQIILEECGKILNDSVSKLITREIIEIAYNNVLKQRIYFEHWFGRLRTAYNGDEFSFAKEILNIISTNKTLSSLEIHDYSIKYKLEASYTSIVNALKYDGYINNNDDPKIYRFNSPLLNEWWYRNVAN